MKAIQLCLAVLACTAFVVPLGIGVNTNEQLKEYVDTVAEADKISETTSLDLRWTEVTDAGLPYIAPLVFLEELDLSWTVISDTGLVHLQSLTNLTRVFLEGTQVSEAGLRTLRAALPDATITR